MDTVDILIEANGFIYKQVGINYFRIPNSLGWGIIGS